MRTEYLLTALAELYLETGREEFAEHLLSLWQELVSTRMYIAGGVGYNELIPECPYDLPQSLESEHDKNSGIAETCGSVGLMMLGWRMHAISGASSVFDVMERTLYNHFLGALSLDHLGIFYYARANRSYDPRWVTFIPCQC